MMIDTHSHIDFEEYQQDFDGILAEIKANEVEKVIIPGVEPKTFETITKLCEKYEMLYGAVGVHPSEYKSYDKKAKEDIYHYAKHTKIIAIGEIGLDYHYGPDTKEEQKKLLNEQLEIAQELELPVLIHDRESHEDCIEIIDKYKLKDVVFHCFSGDKNFAQECLSRGFYIAIGGVVTFKNAIDLKEAVKIIPVDRLLLETDAPYLTPVPYRGKINSPKYLKYIAQEIAKLKETDVEFIKEQTTQNAKRIFNF